VTAADGSAPAIAGAAQVIQRPDPAVDLADLRGPYELMIDAARAAAADAGAAHLLTKLDWVCVVGGFWSFTNPAQVVAAKLGSPASGTCLTALSGSAPQEAIGLAASRIAAGELDVALIVGGEARSATVRHDRAGEHPRWCRDMGEGTPERVAEFPPEMLEEMREIGGGPPVAYALFEDSLRRSLGRSVDEHRDHIAALWARFSAVAAANPYAWDRTAYDAATIRDPSPDNRMIAFPYPKAMVANNRVDLASALLLCSADAARGAGVATDRLVFPQVSTTSHETWRVAERHRLHDVPALAVAGRTALATAGLDIDEIAHIDLYACFPSIVQMSVAALGLDLSRQLTVTGGLGFAGAPVANSSGQAIAAMVPLVREGGHGLVHANGGFATKHAFGIYSAQPPRDGFRAVDCSDAVDHQARPYGAPATANDGVEEARTVVYDRTGPSHTVIATLSRDGRRNFETVPTSQSLSAPV
jgi:acetyl-CoA C-acetyltransferase